MRPYYDDGLVTIYHGDCLEVAYDADVFPRCSQVDNLVLLDLPYNVGKAYDGYDDDLDEKVYWSWVGQVLDSYGGQTLAWFPGALNIERALIELHSSGWTPLRRLLAWHKKEYAGDLFHSGPAMCWEPIIWAGSDHWNKKFGAWGRDLLVVNSTHGDPLRQLHPCPKPPEVLRWLVGLFAPDPESGGSVVDPTMGTGTTLLEAKYLGVRAIGIEQSERYCEVAARRLDQQVLDLTTQREAEVLVHLPEPLPIDGSSEVSQ